MMSSATTPTSSNHPPKIQPLNIANLVAYLANFAITYGVGASGKFPTNAELSAKYQTLVTPAPFAFGIWGIIFMAELVWTIAQLTPKYRSHDIVVHGVGYYFVAACVAQSVWTVFFCTEHILLSLHAMIAILVFLVVLLIQLSKPDMRTTSTGEYWLLKFPFEIHAGWIMAATLVNFNVVLVAWKASSTIQLVAGWGSLVLLAIAAVYWTMESRLVIPFVLAWASFAIKIALDAPNASIQNKFNMKDIYNVKMASAGLGVAVLLLPVFKKSHEYWLKNHAGGSAIDTSNETPYTAILNEHDEN